MNIIIIMKKKYINEKNSTAIKATTWNNPV